jgi:hypothetical protein
MCCDPERFEDVVLCLSMYCEARATAVSGGAQDETRVRILMVTKDLSEDQVAELYDVVMESFPAEGEDEEPAKALDMLVVPYVLLPEKLACIEVSAFAFGLAQALSQDPMRPHVVFWTAEVLALRDPTANLMERAATTLQIGFHPADGGIGFSAELVLVPSAQIETSIAWVRSANNVLKTFPVARGKKLQPIAMLSHMATRVSPPPSILDSSRYATPGTVESCRAADIVLTVPASVE